MTVSVESLVQLRSQLVEDLQDYCECLVETLDRTPWYRQGKPIRASMVAIPFRVLKEETKPPARDRPDERERQHPSARDNVDPQIAALYEEPTLYQRQEEVAWQEERRKVKRAIVIGAPGSGKSFLTEITAVEMAYYTLNQLQEQRIPLDSLPILVHLELADLARQELPTDPADALLELLRQKYHLSAQLATWMRAKLPTPVCWLMLDALDEVNERDRRHLNTRLKALETQQWQCRAVLTCRTANYDRAQVPWGTLTEYELAPFRSQENRQFIEQWFGEEDERGETLRRVLESNYTLNHVCRNPLLVTLTCLAHEERAVTEETRRVDLYHGVLRGLTRRAWKEQNSLNPTDPYLDDLLRLLVPMSRALFEQNPAGNLFSHTQIIGAIEAAIKAIPTPPLPLALRQQKISDDLDNVVLTYASTLLRNELLECGILVGAGLGRLGETQFSFLHRNFLEYLTASSLAQQANYEGWKSIAGLIDKKAWLPEWQEVIILLAGQLNNPASILGLLADEQKDDCFCHRIALAALCLPEIRSVTLNTLSNNIFSIIDRITTTTFFLWWRHKRVSTDSTVSHLNHIWPILAHINGRVITTPLLKWLCKLFKKQNFDLRYRASEGLVQLGEAPSQYRHIFPAVVFPLRDPASFVDSTALFMLGKMGKVAAQDPEVASTLMALLHDPDQKRRMRTLFILKPIGEAIARHPNVLSSLVHTLRNEPDEFLRYDAALALAQIGKAAAQHPDVIPSLVAALHDDSSATVRSTASEAMKNIGEIVVQHPDAILTLVAALGDQDELVCINAAQALEQLGEAVIHHPNIIPILISMLYDSDRDTRSRAIQALEIMGKAAAQHPKVIPALLAVLRDHPDETIRSNAALVLGSIGEKATEWPEVLPTMVDALHKPQKLIRSRTAEALGQIGETTAQHPDIIPALMRALYDLDQEVRYKATEALGKIGKTTMQQPELLLTLVDVLHDPSPAVHNTAREVLEEMGHVVAQHQEVHQALITTLRDEVDPYVRFRVIRVLGQIGVVPQHSDLLSTLIDSLQDPHELIRREGMKALERMGPTIAKYPKIFPALVAALNDSDWEVRSTAAKALGQIGKVATQYPNKRSPLRSILRDSDRDVRSRVIEAVGWMGETAIYYPYMFPALINSVRDPDPTVRSKAVEAIGRIGKVAIKKPAVIPALIDTLRDPDPTVRSKAVEAIGKIGKAAIQQPAVIPALIDTLRDPDPAVRSKAVEAIGKIGKAAIQQPDILFRLINILSFGSDDMRSKAMEVLKQMGDEAVQYPKVIQSLMDALTDVDDSVRSSAAKVLKHLMTHGIRIFWKNRTWQVQTTAKLGR